VHTSTEINNLSKSSGIQCNGTNLIQLPRINGIPSSYACIGYDGKIYICPDLDPSTSWTRLDPSDPLNYISMSIANNGFIMLVDSSLNIYTRGGISTPNNRLVYYSSMGRSLIQQKNFTMVCIGVGANDNGRIYTKVGMNGWILQPQLNSGAPLFQCVTQLNNGTFAGIGLDGNIYTTPGNISTPGTPGTLASPAVQWTRIYQTT